MQFPKLFSPLTVGSTVIPNRVFSTGHQTLFVDNGVPTVDMVTYHEARAAGGTTLIVLEGARPHATSVS